MTKRIAVIGAGAAGSYAAYRLQKRGCEVVVFEREAYAGGRTHSWHDQGWVIDSGAGFITNFYKTLWPLLDELGLRSELSTLSRSNALSDGQRRADFTVGSISSFLTFPFLSPRSKLRMAWQAARITAFHQGLDLSRVETLAPYDDASVRDAARQLFGEEAYQHLVRPSIEPFWYFSCADISRSLMLGLMAKASTAKFYAFRQGMSLLCHQLLAGLRLELQAEVQEIIPQGTGLLVKAAGFKPEIFDGLVLATTASAAAKLVAPLPKELLPPPIKSFLNTQQYVPNIHAAFLVDKGGLHASLSSLFPCGPKPSRLAAINFNSHKQQSRPSGSAQDIVGVFLTAAESEACLAMQKAELSTHAWSLAREFCPELPQQSQLFQLVKRTEAIPVPSVGRYREAAAIAKLQRGPLVFAGDYLASATVDGALQSGLRAADCLWQHLQGNPRPAASNSH